MNQFCEYLTFCYHCLQCAVLWYAIQVYILRATGYSITKACSRLYHLILYKCTLWYSQSNKITWRHISQKVSPSFSNAWQCQVETPPNVPFSSLSTLFRDIGIDGFPLFNQLNSLFLTLQVERYKRSLIGVVPRLPWN